MSAQCSAVCSWPLLTRALDIARLIFLKPWPDHFSVLFESLQPLPKAQGTTLSFSHGPMDQQLGPAPLASLMEHPVFQPRRTVFLFPACRAFWVPLPKLSLHLPPALSSAQHSTLHSPPLDALCPFLRFSTVGRYCVRSLAWKRRSIWSPSFT